MLVQWSWRRWRKKMSRACRVARKLSSYTVSNDEVLDTHTPIVGNGLVWHPNVCLEWTGMFNGSLDEFQCVVLHGDARRVRCLDARACGIALTEFAETRVPNLLLRRVVGRRSVVHSIGQLRSSLPSGNTGEYRVQTKGHGCGAKRIPSSVGVIVVWV